MLLSLSWYLFSRQDMQDIQYYSVYAEKLVYIPL